MGCGWGGWGKKMMKFFLPPRLLSSGLLKHKIIGRRGYLDTTAPHYPGYTRSATPRPFLGAAELLFPVTFGDETTTLRR